LILFSPQSSSSRPNRAILERAFPDTSPLLPRAPGPVQTAQPGRAWWSHKTADGEWCR
jgi:hypothetical protein